MFPLPRVIYAMSSDGLLFRKLGLINERFKTPLIGTALSGVFAGTMELRVYFQIILKCHGKAGNNCIFLKVSIKFS